MDVIHKPSSSVVSLVLISVNLLVLVSKTNFINMCTSCNIICIISPDVCVYGGTVEYLCTVSLTAISSRLGTSWI